VTLIFDICILADGRQVLCIVKGKWAGQSTTRAGWMLGWVKHRHSLIICMKSNYTPSHLSSSRIGDFLPLSFLFL